jgi:hypothetical protein
MDESTDLVNQVEAKDNYDEYNLNNKIVNDIGYSYYYKKNMLNHNDSNQPPHVNNEAENQIQNQKQFQTINTSSIIPRNKYSSQLTNIVENIDNAKRTIQSNIDSITASSESTIESIKSALKTIKENNANTLSRALDNFSTEHPNTALAKEYKLCKEFIENLEIPTAKIEREEM